MNTSSQRKSYLIGFIVTAILLSVTFYLQQFEGFIPCPLCILQRMTLGLLGAMFLIGAILNVKKIGNSLLSLLAALIALLGTFLSGRQVWLQHLPPDKNADCGASLQYLMHVLPFDQLISRILQGTAECTQKGWTFLHISLAGWSLICFIGFFVFCLRQFKRSFLKQKHEKNLL